MSTVVSLEPSSVRSQQYSQSTTDVLLVTGNCEKERAELKLNEKTFSLWGYLTNSADEFVNPLYDHAAKSEVLTVNLSPQNIRFWRGLYCRFESGTHPREPVIGKK